MIKRVKVHVFRVFVNKENRFGNPVGIILDEKKEISLQDRQVISTKLGFSESIFINDLRSGNVSIFNPKREIDFAGHALVGAAYFISKVMGKTVSFIDCKGGQIKTWQENSQTWISANLTNTPPWHYEQLQDPTLVDNLSTYQIAVKEHTMVWAWLDQRKNIVRARTFAPDWGIPEDEANGSGSMQLAAQLNKKLEIHHGKGSLIYSKPAETGFSDVGGKVEEDDSQEIKV